MNESKSTEPAIPVGSVTGWLRAMKHGNDEAVTALWQRYFTRVAIIAKAKLSARFRSVADEEDVAVNVFDTLCRGMVEGRFPGLHDRYDLWRLLIVITHQKTIDQKRHLLRKKRGGGIDVSQELGAALSEMVTREPTPEILLTIKEEHQRLLTMLPNEGLRRLATAKMEGYSNQELAGEFKVSVRTIERKLNLIQERWASVISSFPS